MVFTPSGWVVVKGANTGSFIIMWDMPSDPLNPQNNGNNAFDDTKYKDDPGAIKDPRCPECQREREEPAQPKKKDWWREFLRR